MGDLLAREIAAYRPAGPGPEWWLLLDLAYDADDVTRRTAPGLDYMTARTQAPRSTVFRWLKKLAEAGLIKVVQHSRSAGRGGGKGERAVYEIQVPPRLAAQVAAHLNEVSPTVGPESALRSRGGRPEYPPNQVSPAAGPLSEGRPGVSRNQVPQLVRPPTTEAARAAPVEVARNRLGQDLFAKGRAA